jgi:hypothetical protein
MAIDLLAGINPRANALQWPVNDDNVPVLWQAARLYVKLIGLVMHICTYRKRANTQDGLSLYNMELDVSGKMMEG